MAGFCKRIKWHKKCRVYAGCPGEPGIVSSVIGVMLLTISTTHQPATDLGFLVYKNPGRLQSFNLPFGRIDVFCPEARCAPCRRPA